ncbi:MAG: GtrA family protein, partial [Candidatus Sungbacteria bacterium]|nr:GtrA family protein [Candidatus Sungbacteria bacterium]
TNTTKGILIGGVNAPGFIIAVLNSYYWNKSWVFEDSAEQRSHSDFGLFLLVSVSSLFVNSLIVFVITTYIPHLFGLNDIQWANFAKVIAALASFVWNFTGYKLFVFIKKPAQTAAV